MENQKRIIQKLKLVDILFVALPIVLVMAVFMVIGNQVGTGDFGNLLNALSFFAGVIYSAIYLITALILSLILTRHLTFRISLIISFFAIPVAGLGLLWLIRNI